MDDRLVNELDAEVERLTRERDEARERADYQRNRANSLGSRLAEVAAEVDFWRRSAKHWEALCDEARDARTELEAEVDRLRIELQRQRERH